MFRLFGPARYMRYSLPLFLIFFISLNIDRFFRRINSGRLRAAFLLGFILLASVCFIPKLQQYYIVAPSPELYDFLISLPKDVLVAGHPAPMDNVPVFAKRSVFINEESSLPYHVNFYSIIKERTYAFFKAYYSADCKEIYDFCKKYNITCLVVYDFHFSQDYLSRGEFYLNPFNEYIKGLTKNKSRFALMDIPDSRKIFNHQGVFIVRTEDIIN